MYLQLAWLLAKAWHSKPEKDQRNNGEGGPCWTVDSVSRLELPKLLHLGQKGWKQKVSLTACWNDSWLISFLSAPLSPQYPAFAKDGSQGTLPGANITLMSQAQVSRGPLLYPENTSLPPKCSLIFTAPPGYVTPKSRYSLSKGHCVG